MERERRLCTHTHTPTLTYTDTRVCVYVHMCTEEVEEPITITRSKYIWHTAQYLNFSVVIVARSVLSTSVARVFAASDTSDNALCIVSNERGSGWPPHSVLRWRFDQSFRFCGVLSAVHAHKTPGTEYGSDLWRATFGQLH